MSTCLQSSSVIAAVAGELLRLDGDPVYLWSSCGHVARTFACVTHRQQLANLGQLEMHIENDGPHVVAALCEQHGWEALHV